MATAGVTAASRGRSMTPTAGRTLQALRVHRAQFLMQTQQPDPTPNAEGRYLPPGQTVWPIGGPRRTARPASD